MRNLVDVQINNRVVSGQVIDGGQVKTVSEEYIVRQDSSKTRHGDKQGTMSSASNKAGSQDRPSEP